MSTFMERPLLMGWDDQTWKRAFAWAKVKPVNPAKMNQPETLAPDEWDVLIGVHSKWMEQVGIPEGPSGRIIL